MEMPDSGTSWLDILFFSGLAILLAGFLFVSAVEGWDGGAGPNIGGSKSISAISLLLASRNRLQV
jgi:hypothetical protein